MLKKVLKPQINNGLPEIHPQILKDHMEDVLMIDVRSEQELVDELGHLEGVKNIVMGPELEKYLKNEDKEKEIVFICRSGGRSGHITAISRQMGFQNTINLKGGMILWNQLGFPVRR